MLPQSTQRATGLGLIAVLLWAALAALTTLAGRIPPFQLAAMTFAIGTLVGLGWAYWTGEPLSALRRVPLASWCLGIYGLLAFHVCYFFALQAAPPLEASLIIYLWPLLIVMLSGLLPGRLGGGTLGWPLIVGALLGLCGTILILLGGAQGLEFSGTATGYLAAVAAALIWSSYSVGSRFFAAVPSTAVIGSCAVTAIGALGFHLLLESTVWPQTSLSWLAVAGLGLGPVGLAFYLWDRGMKHGDIRMLGVASYATPLLSTVLLAVLGLGRATPSVWLAAILITVGALIAGRAATRPSST